MGTLDKRETTMNDPQFTPKKKRNKLFRPTSRHTVCIPSFKSMLQMVEIPISANFIPHFCKSAMASGRPVPQCWKLTAALATLPVGRATGPACVPGSSYIGINGLWSSKHYPDDQLNNDYKTITCNAWVMDVNGCYSWNMVALSEFFYNGYIKPL